MRTSSLLFLALAACAGKGFISGQVIDRNGDPVDRAIVKLAPGNVQLVTDREGRFLIDYLRDETGERIKLAKRTAYEVEVWKPGFHTQEISLGYKRGEVVMGWAVRPCRRTLAWTPPGSCIFVGAART